MKEEIKFKRKLEYYEELLDTISEIYLICVEIRSSLEAKEIKELFINYKRLGNVLYKNKGILKKLQKYSYYNVFRGSFCPNISSNKTLKGVKKSKAKKFWNWGEELVFCQSFWLL
jgi:hypothetical protein